VCEPPQVPPIDQLHEARRLSLAALRRDARTAELREAAEHLGTALVETAEDGELWRHLQTRAERARPELLSAEQRAQLEVIVQIDWARLLNESGYRPPPPATGEALALQKAISHSLYTGERANLGEAKERLNAVGFRLIELSRDGEVSRWKLRRSIRKALHVSSKVLVTIGVIVGGGAAAVAMSALLPGIAPIVVQIGVGLAADAAGKQLDDGLAQALRDEPDLPGPELDAAHREALESARRMIDTDALRLVSSWRAYAGETAPATVVADTCRYYDATIAAFYDTWSATDDAPWYWALRRLFEETDARRQRLREELDRQPTPNPIEVADRIERLAICLRDLRDELQQVRHGDDETED
jgi:hypothetical protein